MRRIRRVVIKTPLARAIERQYGMSLLEVSIGLAATAALATAIFMIYKPSDVTAAVKQEQSNLQDLSTAIDRSYGLLGSFSAVTETRLLSDRLVPAAMLRGDGAMRNKWGGAVEVAPETVGAPNDAFAIAYPSVPTEACAMLASSVANSVYDIRIGGISVFAGGELSPAALATRCNNGGAANMIFVYHSGLVSGQAVAATPVTNPPPVAPPPSTPPVPPGAPVSPPTAPPVVVTPPVIVAPPPVVAPPGTPPVVAPPGTPPVVAPPGIPPGAPTAPPPYTQTCQSQLPTPNPATQTRAGSAQAQTLNCAVNQYGDIDQTRPTTENRVVTVACPGNEPWQDPTTSMTAWALASTGSWSTISNTCTACPATTNPSQTQWVDDTGICAAGRYGSTAFEKSQTRSRSMSYNCPVGTRTLPAPTYGTYTPWADTGATRNLVSDCTACPAPSSPTETRWVDVTGACPAGAYGTTGHEKAQTRSRSMSYSCPAGTATLPSPTYGTYTTWADTGATRNATSDCTTCPAPATQTQWVASSAACPTGETGVHTWERQQRRTVSYSCPAGTTTLPAAAATPWVNTSPAVIRNEVDTCAAVCASAPSASPTVVTFAMACTLNSSAGGTGVSYPSVPVVKAATPAGSGISSQYAGGSTANAWQCISTKTNNANLTTSGSANSSSNKSYVYIEVTYGGTSYAGWNSIVTGNNDFCYTSGSYNTGQGNGCYSYGGTFPPGKAVFSQANVPSTVHSSITSYTCP